MKAVIARLKVLSWNKAGDTEVNHKVSATPFQPQIIKFVFCEKYSTYSG
jgi:hypothetical protein